MYYKLHYYQQLIVIKKREEKMMIAVSTKLQNMEGKKELYGMHL